MPARSSRRRVRSRRARRPRSSIGPTSCSRRSPGSTPRRSPEARFTLAVADEATQAVEPALYLALLRAERAVLAGDHLQLPPTVLSSAAQAGGLGVSLFERLAAQHGGVMKVTLAEQHRMNARIMAFPSRRCTAAPCERTLPVAGRAIDGAPLEVVDTSGRGFEEETPEGSDSKHNAGEAALVAAEVEALLALGLDPAEVAVISPYDAQVQRLRQLLAAHLNARTRGGHGRRVPGPREGRGRRLARARK